MKNYTITVNGNIYDVTVEEGGMGRTPVVNPVVSTAAPVQSKAASTPVAPVAPKATGAQGNITVNAPMPGKILGIKANPGQAVKKGDVILVLEAMKMENEIVAPEAGTVAGINVSVGDMVEAGDILASLN